MLISQSGDTASAPGGYTTQHGCWETVGCPWGAGDSGTWSEQWGQPWSGAEGSCAPSCWWEGMSHFLPLFVRHSSFFLPGFLRVTCLNSDKYFTPACIA